MTTTLNVWAMYLEIQTARRWPLGASGIASASRIERCIEFTATAMRAIQVYGPATRHCAEFAKSVQSARDWLRKAQPKTSSELAFQLLGLVWTGTDNAEIQKVAHQLELLQQSDGGWRQTEQLASDAYATGQALYALNQAHALAVTSPAYQRGIHFLLNRQLEDGSWHVRTRVVPIQPLFRKRFSARSGSSLFSSRRNELGCDGSFDRRGALNEILRSGNQPALPPG